MERALFGINGTTSDTENGSGEACSSTDEGEGIDEVRETKFSALARSLCGAQNRNESLLAVAVAETPITSPSGTPHGLHRRYGQELDRHAGLTAVNKAVKRLDLRLEPLDVKLGILPKNHHEALK
jgi:hypothetical protein